MRQQVKRNDSAVLGRTGAGPVRAGPAAEMVARARKSRPGAQRVWRNNYKLKRHRDVADNLKAMATAEITAIDERVEVLVAAYDQLLLKLVYDGTPRATAAP